MRGARSTWPKAGNDVHGSASFRASARAEARCARVPGLSELQKAWSTQVQCPSSLKAYLVMENCALGLVTQC
jgi:hypothetical protein